MPQQTPTDKVLEFRRQGYNNNQIVQILQRDGFSSDQIFDAMNQADIKGNVQPLSPQEGSDQVINPMQTAPQASALPGDENISQRIEELAEVIIDEKWNDLVKNINRIIEWKNKIEARIGGMETNLSNLQRSFDDLNKAVLGKMDDYDSNIATVGSEIKAMEKVFQKIVPALTENISSLSRLTKKFSKLSDSPSKK